MSSSGEETGSSRGASVRYHSLDALRAVMMLLGLVLHAAWLMMPEYFFNSRSDPRGHTGFLYFACWIHVFRMQTFFVIAGFFAHLLVAKRGMRSFLRNRTTRVVLPLFVGMLVLFPLLRWQEIRGGLQTGRIQTELGSWDHTLQHFLDMPSEIGNQWPYHLWFLETLCLLYVLSVVCRFACDRFLDRSGYLRRRVQSAVEEIAGSTFCVPVLAVPVAVLMFWRNSWFGVHVGPLNPSWIGTACYWFIFWIGWCLYVKPDLIQRVGRNWRLKMLAGSLLAVALATVFIGDWKQHRTRVGPVVPEMDLTVIVDEARFRSDLLSDGNAKQDRVRRAIRERIDPEYLAMVRRGERLTSDKAFGLVLQINKNVIDSFDLATIERCADAGLDENPKWKSWVMKPVEERPGSVRKPINAALLHAVFPDSLRPDDPRTRWEAAGYFYAYAVATWLLIVAWFGFFEECFSEQSDKVRYYSDAAYWLYLVHVPVQFEMSLWLGDLSWPPFLKFLAYLAGALMVGVPTYHHFVRSTWVGHWLNGRRYDRKPFLESAVLPGRGDDGVRSG